MCPAVVVVRLKSLLFAVCSVCCWLLAGSTQPARAAGERINHEGRILGPAPVVSAPTLFNTPAADAIVSAMQIFPVTSPWNEDVSRRPLLSNSDAMIAQITADLSASRRTLRPFYEMNFVLVPDNQPLVPIAFFNYADESDPSPYPIPSNLPIETWPRGTGSLTLAQWQQDVNNAGGDRHGIVVMPGAGFIWETWLTKFVPTTSPPWQASNGAKFDLKTNTLRPAGWTSGDAAGLPMFPALVRYDECQRGMVEHALRLVVKRTRVGPIYPATHQASVGSTTYPNIPAMGQRLRLKAGFVIPDSWTREEKAVLLALKKYGAIVADNGNFFSVSVCPDDRFAANAFDHLSTVAISDFEVLQTTGPNEGPRSSGAPSANAGPDVDVAAPNGTAQLSGSVTDPSGRAAVRWRLYSGPAAVAFSAPTQPSTSATFNAPGVYTLMLSVDDGVHAVGYSAVTVRVAQTGSQHPTFFSGEVALANGVYYLAFANGNIFGYYSYAYFPYLYHFDLGFEYFFDANDPARGAFLYDFASSSWFYTSPSFPFPYLYDFGLNAMLYYYPQAGSADRYTNNPRYFFNFATGQIITK